MFLTQHMYYGWITEHIILWVGNDESSYFRQAAGGGQALSPISGEGLQIAIAGGGKLSQVEGATAVRCKWSEVEESDSV